MIKVEDKDSYIPASLSLSLSEKRIRGQLQHETRKVMDVDANIFRSDEESSDDYAPRNRCDHRKNHSSSDLDSNSAAAQDGINEVFGSAARLPMMNRIPTANPPDIKVLPLHPRTKK
jgi:hypothetical protein